MGHFYIRHDSTGKIIYPAELRKHCRVHSACIGFSLELQWSVSSGGDIRVTEH